MYVPTAVAPGIKLKPDTPIPLQLPPTGVPTSGTSVSLIQILRFQRSVAVTGVSAFTVSVAAFEVTVLQVLVIITLYLLPESVVVVPATV